MPLICFQIVEWHQPDRVMRQFGLSQHIPASPSQPEHLHSLTLKGKTEKDWVAEMTPVLTVRGNRLQYEVPGRRVGTDLSYNDENLVWFKRKTKLYIDPKSAKITEVVTYFSLVHTKFCFKFYYNY